MSMWLRQFSVVLCLCVGLRALQRGGMTVARLFNFKENFTEIQTPKEGVKRKGGTKEMDNPKTRYRTDANTKKRPMLDESKRGRT